MGQVPNKTYTAPDGSVYRVGEDGSITKLKSGQMGQVNNKYYISDNGDIFKINEDGSYTAIGNASQIDMNNSVAKDISRQMLSDTTKSGLFSNYNWLYLLSLIMLIVSGTLCIYYDCYRDSAMFGMLSLCLSITAIVLTWVFKTISKICVVILFILMIAALITIIAFSYEWLYPTQIFLTIAILATFVIAYDKNVNKHKK